MHNGTEDAIATTRTTTCRVCESACGLLADTEGDRVVALRPDPDHPVSRGHACRKGTTFAQRIAARPDRILHPRLREDGAVREVGWDEALSRVGERLRALVRAHGPECVGLYSGNAAGQSFGTVLGLTALQRGLGAARHYSCLTLDNSAMFVVAEAVFGNPMATFVADYERSDLVVLVGTDPLSSHASQSQSQPLAGAALRQRAREGGLVVVDPRASVTAGKAALHLQPAPGSDVVLLAWLVREVLSARPTPELGADREALIEATAPFDRQRAIAETELDGERLDALRDRLLAAARPLVWSGLGVLLGPQGTLGWWLTVVLQAALGGLDRPGGWLLQPGAVDIPRWARRIGLRAHDGLVAPVGGWRAILGTLPAATLAADALREAPDRLRALIVIGGDPRSALPDAGAADRALGRLELLVCVDLLPSATSELAHAVLPAATWLERDESGLHTGNQRPFPHLRLDRAVVPPPGSAREDLDVLLDLCRAAGVAPLGSRVAGAALRRLGATGVARALALASGIRWRDATSARGYCGAAPEGDRLADHPAIDAPRLAIAPWCRALAALPPRPPSDGGLWLVTSVRPLGAMNHWLREREPPAVLVHPDDWPHASRRATLRGEAGALAVRVRLDASLARRTVVLPFGDRRCNPNEVLGTGALEPFTGQPVSNGARVELDPG